MASAIVSRDAEHDQRAKDAAVAVSIILGVLIVIIGVAYVVHRRRQNKPIF
jgi:diacylglycerol kinase